MTDISRQLISEDDIKYRLASIFVDSIVLTNEFTIRVVSRNVLDILEFSAEELVGKNINYLTHQTVLQIRLQKALKAGFFEDIHEQIFTKGNETRQVKISGFYLGLVSDLNGYIILKVRFIEKSEMSTETMSSRSELDEFIYRTSHDLRGPLATIRGLVNLVKLRKDNSEVDALIEMIDVNAQKLDDHLFRLFYLSSALAAPTPPRGCLHIETLIRSLHETHSNHPTLNPPELIIGPCNKNEIWGVNEFLVMALLNNLLLYLIGLPDQQPGRIFCEFEKREDHFIACICAKGFPLAASIRKAIQQPSFIYHDLLKYPLLVNYYVAQKMSYQLQGLLAIEFQAASSQKLHVSIPLVPGGMEGHFRKATN